MKKILFSIIALVIGFSALPLSANAETITLTYSNFFPPTHVQSKLAQAWCDEVEKRTDGQVRVSYFPGGTLTKAKQCYDGVVEGISDIGLSALAYSRGRFPAMAAVDLPLGYKSGAAATKVANEVFEKFTPKEFDDVAPMYFHAHGPGLLFTAKNQVKTLEDINGLKLRGTGNSGKLIKTLGGAPVAMSMPDSYQAIRKGVVSGGMYPMESNKGWKMAEVVDYCTLDFPVAYTTTFFVVMNKSKWNSIPTDLQQIITEINKEWAVKHGQAWDESDAAGKEFFVSKGGKFITMSESEGNIWKEKASPMMTEYIKKTDSKGLKGKEILDFTVSSLAKCNSK
ncbi:TRAP-type C4-dicarboxylate transport system, substrate-binding protein [Maridesulfovibrio ferrireducens]|uniref:TRAP-type C4-dicarboxylate transport system, substrate-binding protein n=1 Tax=Maridesulfovibrio ferrireducens TaxID=246191 RepID=A0A1G9GTL0_9BACT|nr:TRAP transporter substrate-binding protein [Maridesulfovibrio ferrireducens]SDL04040.1 TRAP-type C4-dicarboxylate transport system, substrate-binding protein [Maridesulfovibrio ferrireducens]